ncbi:MAG TPA: Crp/Fnr family transcriptional regulator [Polyangia bacterium]|jgi:CRP-like cAMP-binding protein|nr:Crp/Fnr family transcriptional regulator [Polyangia bacterium]
MAIATASLELNPYVKPATTPSIISPELAALQSAELFSRFQPPVLRALAARSSLKQLRRGMVLAATGAVPDHTFLIVRGRIRAVRRGANGREITVESFRPGELLADALAAPDQSLVNDWEATEPSTVLVVPRDALLANPAAVADLAPALSRQLVRRLNRSHDLAVRLVLTDVQGRVVSTLVALGRQEGQVVADGVLIRQRPTQQELANLVGACRETVSRVVSDLTRRGLLQAQGRGLLINRRLGEGNA